MQIEDIWAEYASALRRFLLGKVANEADAEDLLQEILIKTHKNLATLKDKGSIKSWLFQIANNTIIDFYRKRGRTQDIAPEHSRHSDEAVSGKDQMADCILPFINALPEGDAKLLKAIDIENQSQKAYAEQLGVSYSTLKSRVQKSRKLLRGLFDQCCHFDIDSRGNVYDYQVKSSCKQYPC